MTKEMFESLLGKMKEVSEGMTDKEKIETLEAQVRYLQIYIRRLEESNKYLRDCAGVY